MLRSGSNSASTEWVFQNLKSVVPVDASWHMPSSKRSALQEFQASHLKGARFFDIEQISDKESNLPHMLPRRKEFENHMDKLQISNDDHIVLYDNNSAVFSAFRAYWTFKVFGHEKVSLMDGGLGKWIRENKPVETGNDLEYSTSSDSTKTKKYQAFFQKDLVKDYTDILQVIQNSAPGTQILDARSPDRFNGESEEPRPGLKSGHMPGAINVPFKKLMSDQGTLLKANELKHVFEESGVDLQKPIICSCGSGVTASILHFALVTLGSNKVSVYDGSWSEYGSRPESVISKKH